MSNEMKFRAWNKETKLMKDWEFISAYSSLSKMIALNHVNVMQFTGLKDKNGIDIYEGDVIKFSIGYSGIENNIFKVELVNWCWTFRQHLSKLTIVEHRPFVLMAKSLEDEGIFDKELSDIVEIIGNIYTNPELLK